MCIKILQNKPFQSQVNGLHFYPAVIRDGDTHVPTSLACSNSAQGVFLNIKKTEYHLRYSYFRCSSHLGMSRSREQLLRGLYR